MAIALLGGCTAAEVPDSAAFDPTYVGIETRLLEDDLTQFLVEMRGARGPADVDAYARCAAAQYALIRGYAFARQVRTQAAERGGTWFGDAVYVISPGLPRGARTVDAEVTVRDCQARGIPTV
ncbi:MAG: hypothetical protein ACU0BS_03380 [Hasllibacter sp.]